MDLNSLKYAKTHEWVKLDGDTATIGISDFAVQALTDLVGGRVQVMVVSWVVGWMSFFMVPFALPTLSAGLDVVGMRPGSVGRRW